MNLNELPHELRKVYEDAGLTAEGTDNERVRLAMQGLRHAIEEDLKRLRSTRETRVPGQISIRQIRI